MTDIVYLHGLRCTPKIGVWEWEKHITQTLTLDIDIAANVKRAAQNDDLKDALDYQAVASQVQDFANGSRFELIETLAEKIAQLILSEFGTSWVRIKLDKGPAVKDVKNVGIVIERSKQE
ncbi:bifunctional dihydroneopterin aldolase/7,8-dihydroneopterin epimerase [Arenicella sp. 4NH20-0111]|uniref:dihydroneopterin aldolase n=1 Tax=Arenicella sp. 4NH20-0111 TaxID=3127648 RepID=UPI00310886AE